MKIIKSKQKEIKKEKTNCPECQFENGEHSQGCSQYREKKWEQPQNNMNQETRSKHWEELVEILEREFPKNKCQERGQALVLLAYAEMSFKKEEQVLTEKIKEIEGLELNLSEINNGYLIIKRVLSILNSPKKITKGRGKNN